MELELLRQLDELFAAHADDQKAQAMSDYMRNLFPFWGIAKPQRSELTKPFLHELQREADAEWEAIARHWWLKPQREYHYCAMEWVLLCKKKWTKDSIHFFEWLIQQQSWWDTVDAIASNFVGPWFLRWPEDRDMLVEKWSESGHLWLIRTAIIFQLKYKSKTDSELLFALARRHAASKEFFIQKAIGWALRQYAAVNPEAVRYFVETTPLAPLSKREALRHLLPR